MSASRRPPASVPVPELARLATEAGFDLPETVFAPLAAYLEQLMRWNRVMNLVGARRWQDALHNLVVDSFHLAAFLDTLPLPPSPRCWDLGAGAGLPGIPLRMIWTRGTYTLIEAREKRALFLGTCLAAHPLSGVEVYHGRAETFMAGPPPRQADLILSRAFMPWEELLAFVAPGLHPQGQVTLLLNAATISPPAGWTLTQAADYSVHGARRHFVALARSSA